MTRSRAPRAVLLRAAALAVLLLLPASLHAANYLPPWPARVKELCMIRKDGVFHLFYTKEMTTLPFESTTKAIGHAFSHDLLSWADYSDMLPVRPGFFDDDHVWSPHVVLKNGLYWLTYTGVTNVNGWLVQRIGVASSPDLVTWTAETSPVLGSCSLTWAECTPGVAYGEEMRDPTVIPDPDSPNGWLMAFVTHPNHDSTAMDIGFARSTGSLLSWADVTPLSRRHRWSNYGNVVENPTLFKHKTRWFLFYHTDSGHPINYEIGPHPLADSSAWSPMRRLWLMDPSTANTDPWFGPEYLNDNGVEYFIAANSSIRGAEIRRMAWTTDSTFAFVEPSVDVPAAPAPSPGALALHVDRELADGTSVRWSLTLPEACTARVNVRDVMGRHVQTLVQGALPAGDTRGAWDGTTASGQPAPAGIYLLDAVTGKGRASARVVRLR